MVRWLCWFWFDLIAGGWWFGVAVDSRFYCLWLRLVVCVDLNLGCRFLGLWFAGFVGLISVCGCVGDLAAWGAVSLGFTVFVVTCYWCFGVWWLCECCLVWILLFCGFMLLVPSRFVWWVNLDLVALSVRCGRIVGCRWWGVVCGGGLLLFFGVLCCSVSFVVAGGLRVCASCSSGSWLFVVFVDFGCLRWCWFCADLRGDGVWVVVLVFGWVLRFCGLV